MGGEERLVNVGIIVAEKLVDSVVSVERHSKSVLILKMVLDNGLLNVLTVYRYAPHSGKPEEEKEFLEWSFPFGELYTQCSNNKYPDYAIGFIMVDATVKSVGLPTEEAHFTLHNIFKFTLTAYARVCLSL